MKHVLVFSALSLVLASAAPAAAQPLEIIVRGGTPTALPSPLWQGDAYVYGVPFYDNGFNFDPAAAAINAELAINPRSRAHPINVALASELAVYPGSWAEHQEDCQAQFASCDPVSDTILVGGLPRRCPL